LTKLDKFYLTLSNNVVVIGGFKDESPESITLDNPYMVVNDGNQVLLLPYLTDIINQKSNEMVFLKSNIVNVIQAENTNLVQTYIKEITGIEGGGEILLG
jgi:hypothetical protein